MKFDFSEFHPLDHPIRECVGYPGGRLRHARLVWTFKWEMPERLWQAPLHALGMHFWRDYWSGPLVDLEGDPPTGQMCAECGEVRTP